MRRRKNRYTGILRPVLIGRGAPEVSCLLIYDIENDRLRNRIADSCLNYGLERIQYSAFFGKLNRNRREELALALRREIGELAAKIRLIPICQSDLDDIWIFEQQKPEDPAAAIAEDPPKPRPKLRVIAASE